MIDNISLLGGTKRKEIEKTTERYNQVGLARHGGDNRQVNWIRGMGVITADENKIWPNSISREAYWILIKNV